MKKEIKNVRRRPTLPPKAVPSALKGLTSVFGMGTGGTPSLWSPDVALHTDNDNAGEEENMKRCVIDAVMLFCGIDPQFVGLHKERLESTHMVKPHGSLVLVG